LVAVRVDASPLGYLNTAAHGHLDALQVSLWLGGVAMIVDPGTGSYYEDKRLREWLASRLAHNAPCSSADDSPRRFGPFLWAANHARPRLGVEVDEVNAEFHRPGHIFERTFRPFGNAAGLQVEDRCVWNGGRTQNGHHRSFAVRWQFAPGAKLERVSERRFRVTRRGASLEIEVSDDWAEVCAVAEQDPRQLASAATSHLEAQFAGTVSAAFRRVEWAPFLKLVARPEPERPSLFRTTFLAASTP
jgi:hypothetical protein